MSNIISLPDDIIKAIAKPLPPEALKPHDQKSYLTVINAAFLMERLDDCFGIGGWHIDDEGIDWKEVTTPGKNGARQELYAIARVTLTIVEYNLQFHAYGGNSNIDPGDSAKGAITDGFTSCCKQLGIGRHVWMNKDKKGVQDSKTNNYGNTQGQGGKTSTPAPAPTSKPAPSVDAVKAATEFLGHYVFGTVNDLNDALMGLKKSELSADVKTAAGIIMKGHANRMGAAYDKEFGMYMVTAKAT